MKEVTILPADSYIVINKTIITEQDKKILTMLYQPLIGYTAISLYLTLLDDLDKRELMSEDFTHHHLMTIMQLKLDDIVLARKRLEAIGLLKTYFLTLNINNYIYQLFSPLSANEFLNHPILNIVLYNNIGKKEYDRLVNYYKTPRINIKDYTEITVKFSDVFSSVNGNYIANEDISKMTTNNLLINNIVDFNLLISSIPKGMVNEKCFNDETKELVNLLAFIYRLDNLSIANLVKNSLNEKGMVDKQELKRLCRNYYQFDNGGKLPTLIHNTQPEYLRKPLGDNSNWAKMVYTFETISPYDYLRSKYKDCEPNVRDLKLIESLLVDLKMKPGVVNVLIAYVLKVNNQRLSRNYVETIAGQWKRLNIETVEDAMKISEKEHKKMQKTFNKKETIPSYEKKNIKLPDWFDKDLDFKKVSTSEEEEMTEILQKLA